LARATRLGAAPAGRRVQLGIGLSRPDPAGESALIASEYNPHSASYRHFLSPAQFDARFAVAKATVATATRWLTDGGLSVTARSDGGDYLMATGTVAQVDRLLDADLGRYRDPRDGSFIANAKAPLVPRSIPVNGILGLDTVQTAQPANLSAQSPTAVESAAGHRSASAPAFSGVLTPKNLWKLYHEPSSNQGQGQTIGIFGEGETDSVVTQLRLFEKRYHLLKIPVKTIRTEGGKASAYGDNTGAIEWYLDAQASTGMAPKAKQLQLWFAKSLFDKDIAASISKWVGSKHGPREMNASFGECETDPTNPVTGPLAQVPYGTELGDELEPVAEPMLKRAVAEGRTLFASAGDTGSGCPEVVVPVAGAGNGVAPQPLPIVNYPAASAWAVGVGGTVIQTPASNHSKRLTEQAWMDTGGGPSHFILRPTFQRKLSYLTSTNAACPTDYAGSPHPAGSICRGAPDIAALSGNILGNGYFIYIDGEPSSEGGTSLSSPLSMGMWARLQAGAKSAKGLGFANDTFYRQAAKSAKIRNRDFFDVRHVETQGEAGADSTNGGYTARKGWDFVSGNGVMNVRHLLVDVDHTVKARRHVSRPARGALVRSKVTDHSPTGNAENPLDVQAGNLPAIDLTKAVITTTRSTKHPLVKAKLSGPGLSATPDSAAAGGESYFAYWRFARQVYFLEAQTSDGGTTYLAGTTKGGEYTTLSDVTVKGAFKGHHLTMSAPLKLLGTKKATPHKGSLLVNPAAFTQVLPGGVVGTTAVLALTADSASYPSTAKASVGDALCVGHCKVHHAKGRA
jgi:pseudomonalisin